MLSKVSKVNSIKALPLNKRDFSLLPVDPVVAASVGTVSLFVVLTLLERYKISQPNQYICKTGLGINDVKIVKQGFIYPFQAYKYIQMDPINYSFELHAMSSEKMEFVLPGVFTIGPKDGIVSIEKYSKLLSMSNNVEFLIKGILEGETRIQSAQMTIEEIFSDRKAFKEILIKQVQDELDQFGLFIYNANIKELQDAVGSEYFEFIRQKKRSEAENISKVNIAEANKNGNIGAKEREAETRQQVANYEAQTILSENNRQIEVAKSNADLEVVRAQMKQQMEIANIEAKNASLSKDAELQLSVERIRVATETEKLRASDLSQANVRAEIEAKNAEGKARAIEIEAQARANALEMEATALLFAKEKEATGALAMYNSQAEGMRNMVSSFGGNTDAFIKYTMLDKDVYEKLARANADAVRGLNPKITTWNTGNSTSNPIADIMKNLPPLVSTIYDQTGMKPPSWLMDMSDGVSNTTQPDNKQDVRDTGSPFVKGKEATGALAAYNLLRHSQRNKVASSDNTDYQGDNINKS